jgi:endonuclease YncB( thermonuclease family)
VNLKMVKDGYAVPYIYNEGEDSDEELIIDAYKKAKNSNRGLWLKYSKEMECLYNLNNSK